MDGGSFVLLRGQECHWFVGRGPSNQLTGNKTVQQGDTKVCWGNYVIGCQLRARYNLVVVCTLETPTLEGWHLSTFVLLENSLPLLYILKKHFFTMLVDKEMNEGLFQGSCTWPYIGVYGCTKYNTPGFVVPRNYSCSIILTCITEYTVHGFIMCKCSRLHMYGCISQNVFCVFCMFRICKCA